MRKIYKLIVLLLFAGQAVAQAPALCAAPTIFREDTRQLASGEWWRGKSLYDENILMVSDAEYRPAKAFVLPASEMKAFMISRDTFETVHEVAIPRPAHHLRDMFARCLCRPAGYRVAEFVAYPTPAARILYTLLARPGSVAVLPPTNVQFRLALAKVLHDHTALAQQLELAPQFCRNSCPSC